MLVGAAFARGADSSLLDARRAQAKLGPGLWSQVIQIENTSPTSSYPRELHALVFELADVLWFYTSFDGTQSLSLRRGQTLADRADLSPLLRAIDPGFGRWRAVKGDRSMSVARRGGLPNGCFIECVATLRELRERGIAATNAQLLSYYIDTDKGRRGHTVLAYESSGGLAVIDPVSPEAVQQFFGAVAGDALKLARELVDARVSKARWLPFDLPAARGTILAQR